MEKGNLYSTMFFEILLGGFDVPDSTAMWKIRSHIEDDAWPRKKCFKPLNGENNIVNFDQFA